MMLENQTGHFYTLPNAKMAGKPC